MIRFVCPFRVLSLFAFDLFFTHSSFRNQPRNKNPPQTNNQGVFNKLEKKTNKTTTAKKSACMPQLKCVRTIRPPSMKISPNSPGPPSFALRRRRHKQHKQQQQRQTSRWLKFNHASQSNATDPLPPLPLPLPPSKNDGTNNPLPFFQVFNRFIKQPSPPS